MPHPGSKNKEGWGVYRVVPWHMHGVYGTEAEADLEATKVGRQYTVAFGIPNALTGGFKLLTAPIMPPLHGCA
jgi:hypothetical protein